MNNINKRWFAFIVCTLTLSMAIAQENNLQVTFNQSVFKPGDTLKITARQSQKKPPTATLFLLAENTDGMAWEMRWPMLNGKADVALIIPDSLPHGYYRFNFTVLQNLFTVFGKVKSPGKVKQLQATLLTAQNDLYETEVSVDPDGTFTYKNVLFLKDATLIFTLPEDSREESLDIEISTILDSITFPRAGKTLQAYIGDGPPKNLQPFVLSDADTVFPRARVLEAVTVYTKPEKRGEVFNKKYSTGLFKDLNERIINLLDNPALSNAISPLQLIASRTPGFIYSWGIYPRVSWRSQPVQFYIDEFRTDAQQVESLPVQDIALIKTYPPPFFGNPGGFGGAVAVYTKRGGFSSDDYKNGFRVTGYTPLISVFPVDPGRY
jgi:hypothetical protein